MRGGEEKERLRLYMLKEYDLHQPIRRRMVGLSNPIPHQVNTLRPKHVNS